MLRLAAGADAPTVLPFTGLRGAFGVAWTPRAMSMSPIGSAKSIGSWPRVRTHQWNCHPRTWSVRFGLAVDAHDNPTDVNG